MLTRSANSIRRFIGGRSLQSTLRAVIWKKKKEEVGQQREERKLSSNIQGTTGGKEGRKGLYTDCYYYPSSIVRLTVHTVDNDYSTIKKRDSRMGSREILEREMMMMHMTCTQIAAQKGKSRVEYTYIYISRASCCGHIPYLSTRLKLMKRLTLSFSPSLSKIF